MAVADNEGVKEEGLQGRDVQEKAAVSVLFSVPKKAFKRAWKRNLIKRRMRESYRQRKHDLVAAVTAAGRHIDIALICFPAEVKGAKHTASVKGAKKAPNAKKNTTSAVVEVPDFKTIDNAIAAILEQIATRNRT